MTQFAGGTATPGYALAYLDMRAQARVPASRKHYERQTESLPRAESNVAGAESDIMYLEFLACAGS